MRPQGRPRGRARLHSRPGPGGLARPYSGGGAIPPPAAASRVGLAPLRGGVGAFVLLGLFNNGLPFWLLSFAEGRIASGLTAVIQAAAPIFTALLPRGIDPPQRGSRSQLAG